MVTSYIAHRVRFLLQLIGVLAVLVVASPIRQSSDTRTGERVQTGKRTDDPPARCAMCPTTTAVLVA
jgi:hypothetical protein